MSSPGAADRRQAEFRALVAICLEGATEAGARIRDPAFDLHKLMALAERHRVQGLVGQAISEARTQLPDDIAGWIGTERRRLAIAYLARTAETVRLVRLLSAAGIEVLMLKGNPLAQMLYAPRPELRQSIDIDLLVAPEAFAAADRVLGEAGYQRNTPAPSLSPAADSMARYLCSAFEYSHPSLGCQVELHHRLITDPHALDVAFADLAGTSDARDIGGTVVRSLAGTDLAIYLCSHAAGHRFFRLKWLADIVRLFDRLSSEDFARLLDRARQLSSERACLVAMGLVERLTSRRYACLDDQVRRSIAPLAEQAMTAMCAEERQGVFRLRDVPDDLAQLVFSWHLADRWSSRRFALLQHLVNQQDLATLKLGVAWTPLYALLGRPLALVRWLSRKANA